MKKAYKILTNVLLGALTLSSLGLANVQAGEVVPDPSTDASVKIEDGKITDTYETTALTFDGLEFSFATFFGSSPSTTTATGGNIKLKVDDQRSLNGITNGWKLTAKLSPFKNKKDQEGAKSLGENTFISLKDGVLSKATYDKIDDPKVANTTIQLYAKEEETKIWFADRGENKLVGVDEWTLTFPHENILLTIPNDELVGGEHEATITWTFSATIDDASEPDPVD